MSDYIKICPRCGHYNPEENELCDNPECCEFLGSVVSVPAPSKRAGENNGAQRSASSLDPSEQINQNKPKVTQRLLQPRLYLQCLSTEKIFEVHSGHIVGQAHATSRAHIQMSDIPNINFVSREHCQFNFENGQWFVTAIRTATNPTYLNQILIGRGEKVPIKNGDRLTMANVPFEVRIIES